MIVYVLSVNGDLVQRFARLPDAIAYPFEAGIVAVNAGRWKQATRGRLRRWELIEAGVACVVTEVCVSEGIAA